MMNSKLIKFYNNYAIIHIQHSLKPSIGLLGPGVHHLPVYWAYGPSQEQGSARGREVFVRRDCVDELKGWFWL